MKQKITNVFIFSLFITLFSCSQADNKATVENGKPVTDTVQKADVKNEKDSAFENTWANFANAVKATDVKTIKALSTDCILCEVCLYNTDKENKAYNATYKIDETDTLPDPKGYYAIDKFIKEDYAVIFDSAMRAAISDPKRIATSDSGINHSIYTGKSCIAGTSGVNNTKLKQVYVDMPGPANGGYSWTGTFTFIETKNGYRFCGYDTGN